jgi:lipid II:glycine glycyltransferase (peptidoglycan interpeptide bridge formation enzyme)
MATIAALREEYVERRHLCLRLRPWAYDLPNDAGSTILSAFREARALHKTYILDLSRSEAELRALMDKKWRANLRKAERSGLAVTTCGDNNDGVKIFIELHKQMCERKAFRSAFDDSYLACQMQLPEAIRPLIFVCRQGDSPVAAAVVSAIGNRAIMLNAASGDAALSVRAGYLLQWTIVRWLKESGRYCWYDLNDSRSSPGVRQFKRGLVGAKAPEIAMSEFMTCKSHAFSRMLETSIRLRELCHQ